MNQEKMTSSKFAQKRKKVLIKQWSRSEQNSQKSEIELSLPAMKNSSSFRITSKLGRSSFWFLGARHLCVSPHKKSEIGEPRKLCRTNIVLHQHQNIIWMTFCLYKHNMNDILFIWRTFCLYKHSMTFCYKNIIWMTFCLYKYNMNDILLR